MRHITQWLLFIPIAILSSVIIFPAPAKAQSAPLSFNSSTQFLWGDDLLGENQAIVVQYLRFGYNPDGKKYSLAGYGRLWEDFGSPAVRSDDFSGRLYYLYLDYEIVPQITTRIGRQFTNFTAGTSLMDGVRLDVRDIGPVGITLAGGRTVTYSLDSEFTRDGNYFVGVDVHLQNVRATQLGISYVRKYDESDLAREELGMNFRYFYKIVSPYVELKYDVISEVFDEATVGVDVFPVSNLSVKAEFYHSYPTFDTTSIYSVFAVDKYREYLIRAEYSLSIPVTVYASYRRQTYEEDTNADVYTLGAKLNPMNNLSINAAFDYRKGYTGYAFNTSTGVTNTDGKLYGFELYGDYRPRKDIVVFAGVQLDTYDRPELNGNNDARRYWAGGRWTARKNLAVTARIEDNDNPNFSHRFLGRVALDWNL